MDFICLPNGEHINQINLNFVLRLELHNFCYPDLANLFCRESKASGTETPISLGSGTIAIYSLFSGRTNAC